MRWFDSLGYGSRFVRAASARRGKAPTYGGSCCELFTATSTSHGCHLSPPYSRRMIGYSSVGLEFLRGATPGCSRAFEVNWHLDPSRWYGLQAVRLGHTLSRDWLAKLWAEDKRDEKTRQKRAQKGVGCDTQGRTSNAANFSGGWFPFTSKKLEEITSDSSHVAETTEGPDLTTYNSKSGANGTFEGVHIVRGRGDLPQKSKLKLADVLGRSDLLVTRDIEWANLMFAFEQESRYKIVDPRYPDAAIGSIHEQSNVIFRQLLRTRRPFVAYVLDAYGYEIFRIRRPFWWINSTIYAEVDGKEIGVVHRRWHLWRRIYDLYLGNKQFAIVENPGFWNWTFTLKDENDMVLAEINRDWRGFGFEMLTDAGQYVIRFGPDKSESAPVVAENITNLQNSRLLTLPERAVAVALAVSLDCDYFSRHGGWGLPILVAGE